MTPTSLAFDAETGRPDGTFTPQMPAGRNENYWMLANGEMVAGKDGNLYVINGKGQLRRYGPTGVPLPFADANSHVLEALHHGHTRAAGLFVDRTGRI